MCVPATQYAVAHFLSRLLRVHASLTECFALLCVQTFVPSELTTLGMIIFKFCRKTGICSVIEEADGSVKMSNMTIICLVLHVCGPMREDMLTKRLLSVQVLCTAFAFIVRCVSSGIRLDCLHALELTPLLTALRIALLRLQVQIRCNVVRER